jgi:hypothetical protein
MAAKKIAAKAVPVKRPSEKRIRVRPRTITAEAGDAVASERSIGAVVRRCTEARTSPALEGCVLAPSPPLRRPRGTTVQQCGRRIQREMSRSIEPICAMLLEETLEKRNLMALRALLQLAVFYGANRAPGLTAKATRASDAGFARRMVEEYRLRSAAPDGQEKSQAPSA